MLIMDYSDLVNEFRKQLHEVTSNYQNLVQRFHKKSLLKNEIQTKRWEGYKKELVELNDRFLSLRDELSHAVMVPVGKKALMRGRLVHTNEIMVCLGDGWFAMQTAKQAADICHRRIQHCDEMLEKLKKEEELLNNMIKFPFESEAFCNDNQTQEIIEPYDEEEEKLWREKHRQKEREYRQKLAEVKKTLRTKVETEEDVWKRLDALDIQEELEDELNRLQDDEDVEEEDEDSEDDSDSDDETSEEEEKEEFPEEEEETSEEEEDVEKKTNLERRVSFKEETGNDCESETKSDSSDDNTIKIVFKHSETPVSVPPVSCDEIVAPSEIYSQYLKQKMPKSILKTSSVSYPTVDDETFQPVSTSSNASVSLPPIPAEPAVKAVSDEVVERAPATTTAVAADRPLSRFKAARIASKK